MCVKINVMINVLINHILTKNRSRSIRLVHLAALTAAFIMLMAGGGCGNSSDGDSVPFEIVVLSDVHVRIPGNPDDAYYNNQRNLDNLQSAVDTINTRYGSADFVAVTGDLVGCLFSEDPNAYLVGGLNPAEKFKEIMDGLIPPYYVSLGNHDYQIGFDAEAGEGISTDDIELVEAVWGRVLGISPYYSFVHKGVHFIFLNSNRGASRNDVCPISRAEKFCTGSFDDEQLLWLDAALEAPEPAVLFFHHPVRTDSPNTLWVIFSSFLVGEEDGFYDIVQARLNKIMAIFVGHGHLWQTDTLHGSIDVYETAAIGDLLGSAGHISVVEIDPHAFHVTVTRHQEED